MIGAFFERNMLIVRVIYAILFFLYAFAIVVKVNRKSELKLAKTLWLLAVYGFAFGLTELVTITLLVKAAEFTQSTVYVLKNTELVLRAFAFMVILWLGIRLVSEIKPKLRVLYRVGLAMCLAWSLLAVYTGLARNPLFLGVMDNLSRYVFSVPGLFLSGYGLLLHVREIEKFKIPSLVTHVRGLAYTFFVGVFLIGMIATYPVMWPAVILNRDTFMEVVGIPVIFFRSLYLISLTYFVIKIVNVFEIEREHRLEEALRRQVLVQERDRIARELHDGIIQSIYGVGLKLKQYSILCEKKPEEANRQIDMVKTDLSNIIQDIRDYIEELHLDDYSSISIRDAIVQLTEEFRASAVMDVQLSVEGRQAGDLNIVQVSHVLQILRELLANAVKHSRASTVRVSVLFTDVELIIRVSDDGIGFNPEMLKKKEHAGEHQGLENMFHRVMMLQGSIVFHSAPGQGTHFEIVLPYRKQSYLQSVYIEDAGYFTSDAEKGRRKTSDPYPDCG